MSKKRKAIKILNESAKVYDEKLAGNKYLIIACSIQFKTYDYYEIQFDASNFMHLTGVQLSKKKKLSAGQFYSKCLNGRLSESDFELKKNGSTMLKLGLLPEMFNLDIYRNAGFFDEGSYVKIEADIATGNSSGVLALKKLYSSTYSPCSLLADDIENCVPKMGMQDITHIYKKKKSDRKYNTVVYLDDKEHDLNIEIQEMISKNID